jgi:hypothetical protein
MFHSKEHSESCPSDTPVLPAAGVSAKDYGDRRRDSVAALDLGRCTGFASTLRLENNMTFASASRWA